MTSPVKNTGVGPDTLHERLSEVANMDRLQLLEEWKLMHGKTPPKHLSRRFMVRALIYEAQCNALGRLSKGLQKRLKSIAHVHVSSVNTNSGASVDSGPTPPDNTGIISKMRRFPAGTRPLPRPGTTLVREWNGRTYQVEVTDEGYVMNGEPFRSLSAIALRITGTKWSGPRFFSSPGQPSKFQQLHLSQRPLQ